VKEWLKSVLNYRCYPKNKAGYPFLDHPLELPGWWLLSLTDARPGSSRPSDIWSEFEPGWNRVQTRNWQIASLKADNLAVSAQETNGSVIKNRLWRVTACLIGLYERPDVRESVAVSLHAFGLVNSLTLYQLCCCDRTCAEIFWVVLPRCRVCRREDPLSSEAQFADSNREPAYRLSTRLSVSPRKIRKFDGLHGATC